MPYILIHLPPRQIELNPNADKIKMPVRFRTLRPRPVCRKLKCGLGAGCGSLGSSHRTRFSSCCFSFDATVCGKWQLSSNLNVSHHSHSPSWLLTVPP